MWELLLLINLVEFSIKFNIVTHFAVMYRLWSDKRLDSIVEGDHLLLETRRSTFERAERRSITTKGRGRRQSFEPRSIE